MRGVVAKPLFEFGFASADCCMHMIFVPQQLGLLRRAQQTLEEERVEKSCGLTLFPFG